VSQRIFHIACIAAKKDGSVATFDRTITPADGRLTTSVLEEVRQTIAKKEKAKNVVITSIFALDDESEDRYELTDAGRAAMQAARRGK
jgi:hypothetical protein